MCGIVGFFRHSGIPLAGEDIIRNLARCLHHRGPDDAGFWVDADRGVALAHRRLSILDLSPAGHQPMISASGRYVVALNGEIYNHQEIRREIESLGATPVWRGHSDTEVLLAGFDRWGVEGTLTRTVGMFAFALWDRKKAMLTLARDRIGEKPLYYGWQNDVFLFGSELKALRAYPEFRADIDREVLEMYMSRGYITAPYSIYKNTFKLLPGTYLQLSLRSVQGTLPTPRAYWSLSDAVESGAADPFSGGDQEAIDELEAKLMRAVAMQTVADVPLGAFLSGGIDSSTIVAIMQAQSSRPVKTFTIGFHEAAYQEAGHAKSIAQHLHTDHTELYVTPREAMEVIPKLPVLYDEPFGDSSAIPTFLVSQLARRHVTVSLSGDGGDELFGGYARYQRTNDIWRSVERTPRFARNALSHGVRVFSRCVPGTLRWKAKRLALYLSANNAEECYQEQIFQRRDRHFVVGGVGKFQHSGIVAGAALYDHPLYNVMMYSDTVNYLPDSILVKVDRASMGVSLESRVPLLDHRIVEFVWRLPLHMKVRNREPKWLLKQVLGRYVPSSLTERPKMGFGVPVSGWIRGALRDWAEDLLSEERLKRDGFLCPRLVREQWSRHLSGGRAEGDSLWQVLMFQAWLAATHS